MIHNDFFNRGQGPKQIGFASPVGFLPATLILASFRALAVPEAGVTELGEAGFETAGEAAISLSPVAVGAYKEEATAIVRVAKSLAERLFRGR